MTRPDIIIVGAGSAGCILARRLAIQGRKVVLIEPQSAEAPATDQMRPAQWLNLLGSEQDWGFATEKVDALAGRSLMWPRGRGIGGSSRINAMIWFPPTKADRRQLGSMLNLDSDAIDQAYASVASIAQPEAPCWVSQPATQFFESMANRPGNEMVYQRANRNGKRWLPKSILPVNVQIVRATVDRVCFERDRAIGVVTAAGETILCCDHVVLSAGAIATPMILMRSGIGDQDTLANHGIATLVDAPNVGKNLQDHLIMPVIFGTSTENQFPAQPTDASVRQWQKTGDGPVACNLAEAGGLFLDDRIQIHVTPTHYLTYPSPKAPPAMTIGVNITQPKSRGCVSIVSADPTAPPKIDPNYFAVDSDLEKTIEAVRFARELAAEKHLSNLLTGELLPGEKRQTDHAIAKAILRYSQTLYHPVGTAAEVETGIENLHIVDASALKNITIANPNATIMTLAQAYPI